MFAPFRDGAPVRVFQAYVPPAAAAILTLTPATCHWPLGECEGDGFRFCGEPRRRGSYCAHHARLARRRSR